MTFASKVISFYQSLELDDQLPQGVELLNPYRHEVVKGYCKQFYELYFNDSMPRKLILGINPGRFGSGLTGIGFTDPIQLEQVCAIPNVLPKKAELSSSFMYKVIARYGGPSLFYKSFFVSAVCPLGFIQNGKNLNYFDLPSLQKIMEPFILKSLQTHISMGIDNTTCFCLGGGKNLKYLQELNNKHQFFQSIVALPHPRFVMQYKRKEVDEYVKLYTLQLKGVGRV